MSRPHTACGSSSSTSEPLHPPLLLLPLLLLQLLQ
jgi:hypothetical protein